MFAGEKKNRGKHWEAVKKTKNKTKKKRREGLKSRVKKK